MKKESIDNNILAHTSWNCKYHIVFAPKYRRKVFFEEKWLEIREILRKLCQWKGVEIIEGEVCPDHIHMLVSIPSKMSVSGFMGYLKGKSALLIFQKWGNMKFAYRNREFWCKGYYVDTVGKNTKAIIIHPARGWFFLFGHSPNTTSIAQMCFYISLTATRRFTCYP